MLSQINFFSSDDISKSISFADDYFIRHLISSFMCFLLFLKKSASIYHCKRVIYFAAIASELRNNIIVYKYMFHESRKKKKWRLQIVII